MRSYQCLCNKIECICIDQQFHSLLTRDSRDSRFSITNCFCQKTLTPTIIDVGYRCAPQSWLPDVLEASERNA